jgi:hypothetical protein
MTALEKSGRCTKVNPFGKTVRCKGALNKCSIRASVWCKLSAGDVDFMSGAEGDALALPDNVNQGVP